MDNKIITTEKAKSKGKTIQINPEFLKLNGNSKKNTTVKRERKQKPIQNVDTNPSLVKKKLIEKIQAFKNKAFIENKAQEKEEDKEREKFNNEFNKSLDFLQSLSNKRKENKEQNKVHHNKVHQNKVQQNKVQQSIKNKTLKHGKIERTIHNEVINDILETELPPELSSTFRYPPQKNINFLIDENLTFEPMQSDPMQSEPMQSDDMQSDDMQSDDMQSDDMQSDDMQSMQSMQSKPMQSKPMQSMQSDDIQNDDMQSNPMQSQPMQSQSISKEFVKEPAYSNLKNGSKPTFREWKNQTVKNHHMPKHKKLQIDEEPILKEEMNTSILQELKEFRQKPIEHIENKNSNEEHEQTILSMDSPVNNIQSIKKITTRTLKYKLGKRGKKVGVLIKNAKTRKIIQREYALLKQKQISDIKNYLRSKNLLKIGSDAPNDVLRQMYEQAILSGEVENKAGETLIHNFMNSH
jgi:hypothetical protein